MILTTSPQSACADEPGEMTLGSQNVQDLLQTLQHLELALLTLRGL